MINKRSMKAIVLSLLLLGGVWLLASSGGPAPETAQRQDALQAMAPGGSGSGAIGETDRPTISRPTVVNLGDIPAGVYDPNNQYDRWRRGEIDLEEELAAFSAAESAELRRALQLAPSSAVQQMRRRPPALQRPGGRRSL